MFQSFSFCKAGVLFLCSVSVSWPSKADLFYEPKKMIVKSKIKRICKRLFKCIKCYFPPKRSKILLIQ